MGILDAQQQEALKAAIQDGLPLTPAPYLTIATALGLQEGDVIRQIEQWLDNGFIKRMGLVVRHHQLGYSANAMVVWDVPDARVDELGERFRQFACVTLCYRRPRRRPDWPYNLFCMIHGQDRARVLGEIAAMVAECRLQDIPHEVLFSNKQYKQTGGHYARKAARTGA